MFNVIRRELEWGGGKLSLETGKIARQASGSIVAQMGGTVVLCTAVGHTIHKEGVDFLPLTVNYQEKYYAAGKIPGGFFKRESKPTERETLISRLIDRPIRPLFPHHYCNDTQIIATVLSYDPMYNPDIIAMIGCSAALAISGIPFEGPVAGARVGYKKGNFILNPSLDELATSELDLVVAGTKDSVLMVESEAKELSEEVMLDAVMFGHSQFQPVIAMIEDMAQAVGNAKWPVSHVDNSNALDFVAPYEEAIRNAYSEVDKQTRRAKLDGLKQELEVALVKEEHLDHHQVMSAFKHLEKKVVRGQILNDKVRIDGRKVHEIRAITCEVDVLPMVHGSALFTRGETQVLAVTTLGTTQSEQIIDDLEGDRRETFMLHYNFPPYSVGEVSMLRGAGRREIGHGKLAQRAMKAVMPTADACPYTIRVVSEVTACNGSSSMATVCGTSMSLMASGIPIKSAVAGIAMGLVKEGNKVAILSDIMGDEDHLGDMDFKVAGTEKGVTALQMDIKIKGIDADIMSKALVQAHDGRIHILQAMNEVINMARPNISKNAPMITKIQINPSKIGEVIGPQGKVIKNICEVTGAEVNIDDDGTVKIAAISAEAGEAAKKMIEQIVQVIETGSIHTGKVVKTMEFGAIVEFGGRSSGMIHISELAEGRVEDVTSVLNAGDTVKVKVISVERDGKIKLSLRDVNQETGEDISNGRVREERPRREGNDRPRGERRESGFGGDRPRGERREGGFGGGNRPRGERREGGFGGRSERGERGDRNGGRRDNGNEGGDKKRRFF
jgi:polyribonucleotide nucleotidyltransferase